MGVNKSSSKSRDENLIDRLQVAEFDYREVGIEYIETNVFDDFRKKVINYKNILYWCPWRESDPRPLPYQGSALPLSHMGRFKLESGAGDEVRPRDI